MKTSETKAMISLGIIPKQLFDRYEIRSRDHGCELWGQNFSSHPWKEREYPAKFTGIVLTISQVAEVERLGKEIAARDEACAASQQAAADANQQLHESMIGKMWNHDFTEEFEKFSAQVSVDGLGWQANGCHGNFPKAAKTEAEAVAAINAAAEDEILCSIFCE